MTEKRFIRDVNEISDSKYNWIGDLATGNETDDDFLIIGFARTQEDAESLCDLLNELNNENEQLKRRINDYCDLCAISVEILNEEDEVTNEYATILANKFDKILKENEQLKQELFKVNMELLNIKNEKLKKELKE